MVITKGGVNGQHSMLACVDFRVIHRVIEEELNYLITVSQKQPRDYYVKTVSELAQIMC